MTKRNPAMVLVLSLITFGIYALVWLVKSKGEMNARGANIPTAWLIIIPLVGIFWMWKYAEGVQSVTQGKMTAVLAFLGLIFVFGYFTIPAAFNEVN